MPFTKEQIIAELERRKKEQAPIAMPAQRDFTDDAGDAIIKAGRMALGGSTGIADLLTLPVRAPVNYITGENTLPSLRDSLMQAYDERTGQRGVPQNATERVIQAGGEALTGGGVAGGLAKAAGAAPAVVETLGINKIPTALAEIGAGAGAQVGSEIAPDSALAPFFGGLLGSLTPQAVAGTPKALAKAMAINPDKVATLERAGIPLNIPAASDSNSIRSMASASQNILGGGKLKQSMDSAYKKAEKSLRDLGFSGTTTPEMAGATVKQGLVNWRNQKKTAFKNMDAIFDELVPPMTKLNGKAFSDFADNAIDAISRGNGLTQQQIATRMNHPAIQQLRSLSDAAKQGEPITLNALNEARKTIGELTAKSPLTPDFDSVITANTYDALHQVRREAARAVGGEKAVNLLDEKNRFYKKYIDEEKSFNAKLIKKLGDNPESVFQQMTSGDKAGASNARRTLARLTDVERDGFRDALIYQKGGGENFSIGKWAAEYAKMSKEAKSAFFMGKPDLQSAHDDLMRGVETYKELGRFKNTSNTAAHNLFNQIITGGAIGAVATGLTDVAIGLGSGLAANKAFASIMASSSATKMLANALKSPPATESALATSLVKMLKASGYTDDTALQEAKTLLENQGNEPPNKPQFTREMILRELERRKKDGYTQEITPQNNFFEAPPINGSTRGIRNNNPGNLRGNDLWLGRTGQDEGGFLKFKTPQAGIRALAINIKNQQKKHGINTIEELINKYAPKNENDTANYIQFVSEQTGINPRQRLNLSNPKNLYKLSKAIILMENGSVPYDDKTIRKAIHMAVK